MHVYGGFWRLEQIVGPSFYLLFYAFSKTSLAGEIVAPTRPDIPRGLNQLGNTCYLNSLLQVREPGGN